MGMQHLLVLLYAVFLTLSHDVMEQSSHQCVPWKTAGGCQVARWVCKH